MENSYIHRSSQGAVGIIQINRPEVLNALNLQVMNELVNELERMDKDMSIRTIVLTGNEKAFAAGADIAEMADEHTVSMLLKDQFAVWDRISLIKKPMIGAVSGFALGGGCELMMNCDLVVASETAMIGQPEIKLGLMPGAGGTQRLVKNVGLLKAMEMLLTGEPISAREALRFGLVNKVVPVESYMKEALTLAKRIAAMPPVAVGLIKKVAHQAVAHPLESGLQFERNAFYLLFGTEDSKEGMQAFGEKRQPRFTGK